MRITALLLMAAFSIVSCSKSNDPEPTAPVTNNGPLGGTYNFTGSITTTYDTTTGPGIITANEYKTTTTNHSGTVTFTGTNISSKGLMYDFSTVNTRKETNTSNGATVTTNGSPYTGTSGSATSTNSSNYTIDATSMLLTIENGQYLFNPAFISQPSDKKYSYTLVGNTLKVVTNAYNASSWSRSVNEATFTKQ